MCTKPPGAAKAFDAVGVEHDERPRQLARVD
jgi:hypothetical protein